MPERLPPETLACLAQIESWRSPPRPRDILARAIGDQLIQVDGKREWRKGVRLGPQTSGAGSNNAKLVQCAPPAIRKTAVRELLILSSSTGLLGFPPTIHTDASTGFSRRGYRSADLAFNLREQDTLLVVCLRGTLPRAHAATKQNIAQSAKVGYCPCPRELRTWLSRRRTL